MQSAIISYVERLQDEFQRADCSPNQAIAKVLPTMSLPALFRLRDGAFDLQRIVDLELGRRDERVDVDALVRRGGL